MVLKHICGPALIRRHGTMDRLPRVDRLPRRRRIPVLPLGNILHRLWQRRIAIYLLQAIYTLIHVETQLGAWKTVLVRPLHAACPPPLLHNGPSGAAGLSRNTIHTARPTLLVYSGAFLRLTFFFSFLYTQRGTRRGSLKGSQGYCCCGLYSAIITLRALARVCCRFFVFVHDTRTFNAGTRHTSPYYRSSWRAIGVQDMLLMTLSVIHVIGPFHANLSYFLYRTNTPVFFQGHFRMTHIRLLP